MRLIIIFLLCFSPFIARADFIAGFGLQGGSLVSENKNDDDRPYLESPLGGIRGEIELGHSFISGFVSFDYSYGSGDAQYDYTDPDDSSESAQVEDLKVGTGLTRFILGARLRFINFKVFRMFVGGGYQQGFLSLTYDKDDFKERQDSTEGFEEFERQSLKGYFMEGGLEYIFSAESGIRLSVRRTITKTEKFVTLADERLKFDQISFGGTFIQYVDM
ncbi:MAG: outer membrane beta-barrel protein [Bacteriovoracia bacterium]